MRDVDKKMKSYGEKREVTFCFHAEKTNHHLQ